MSAATLRAAVEAAYRDYVTAGVPASGDHDPDKAEIRAALGANLETELNAEATARAAADSALSARIDAVDVVASAPYTFGTACALATTANVTLSGEQTIDGTLTSATRILVKDQTAGAENGVYVTAAGAWTRATDADTGAEIGRKAFLVLGGTANEGRAWQVTNATTVVVGTDAITLAEIPGTASLSGLARIDGDDNFFLGGAGNETLSGGDNIGSGPLALSALTTGFNNVASGHSAGLAATTANYSSWFGWGSGTSASQSATVYNSTAIGANSYTTTDGQVALGDDNVTELRMFGSVVMRKIGPSNLFIGSNPGNNSLDAVNGGHLGIGFEAMADFTGSTSSPAIAIGYLAMNEAINASHCVAIGDRSMLKSVDLVDCTTVGGNTLKNATTGVGDTAVGYRALENATAARNNTALGDSALWLSQGQLNLVGGYVTAEYMTSGDYNVIWGAGACRNRADGSRNTFTGYAANQFPGVTPNTETGVGAQTAGDDNSGFGHQVLLNATGSGNTAGGAESGRSLTTATNSTFLGFQAGYNASQKVDATNSMALGYNAYTTANNQVVLGNDSVAETLLRGFLEVGEVTAPSAPGSNKARIYIDDNGSGKTRLMVRFPTGAAVQLAIEP